MTTPSDADQLLACIRDEAANPLDRADALHRLQELRGYTQGELAAEAGFSDRRVRELLSLRGLPAVLQAGLCDGMLTITHVRVLRKLSPEQQVHWCQVVGQEGLAATALKQRVADHTPPPAEEPAAPPAVPVASPDPPPTAIPMTVSEPLDARDEGRLAQLLAAYPHLPQPSAEAMIRFVGASPFGQQVLDPLEEALEHLPEDLAALTGSQAMTLVALLNPLLARLAAVRDIVQSHLGGDSR